MLITFHTKTFANITMFGNVGIRLIELMGHSATVPGAISAEDVPAALSRLRKALDEEAARAPEEVDDSADADEETEDDAVSLAHRALPLIGLLEAAAAANDAVMWDA